jgi:hypothetical protein
MKTSNNPLAVLSHSQLLHRFGDLVCRDRRGNRCSGTRAMEYHHIRPYGKGGGHQANNIALRCRAHNQHQADLDFGRDFMDRKRTADMPGSALCFGPPRLVGV